MSFQATVSIIITVKNDGVDLFMTMESLKVSRTLLSYEVIIVNDGSIDGCCDFLMNYKFPRPIRMLRGQSGVPSRNLAAAHATGEYLIFCSPRLYFEDEWMELLLEPLIAGAADCVSPAFTLHESSRAKPKRSSEGVLLQSVYDFPRIGSGTEIPWLSGECFALSRERFQDIGGMADGFSSKELETAEFSLRVWLFGGICRIVPQVALMQVFRHNFPSDDSGNKWEADLLRLACLHLNERRIAACRELISRFGGPEILRNESVILDSAELLRDKYASRRIYDDSWFFDRFGISF
ncbi:glycosyltransferase family 2 protein [Paenibacillus sp. M1]|uniref:Glycosyltransferase family 2 protein n=1 Tax=Paenibacillus haidiansis TaxID=1574488 RepID=A0ABU7VXA0_9BACL